MIFGSTLLLVITVMISTMCIYDQQGNQYEQILHKMASVCTYYRNSTVHNYTITTAILLSHFLVPLFSSLKSHTDIIQIFSYSSLRPDSTAFTSISYILFSLTPLICSLSYTSPLLHIFPALLSSTFHISS